MPLPLLTSGGGVDKVGRIRSSKIEDYDDWLKDFHRSGGLAASLALWLRHFTHGDGLPVRGGAGDEHVVVVFEDEFVVIHLRWLSPGKGGPSKTSKVTTSPFASVLLPFAGSAITYTRFSLNGVNDMDVLTKDAMVTLLGTGTCDLGCTLEVVPDTQCLLIDAPDEGTYVLQVSMRQSLRLIWTFDLETRQACSVSSASVAATRDQLACRALGALGQHSSIEALCQVAREHQFHFVRMEAIRSLFGMGYRNMLELLRERSQCDPHRHVRNACLRNLELCEADQ